MIRLPPIKGAAALLRSRVLRLAGVSGREVEVRDQLTRIGVLLYEVDLRTGRYLHLSGPVRELTGWTPEHYAQNIFDLIHPDDRDAYWIDGDSVTKSRIVDRTARIMRADGTYMWLRDLARVQVNSDDNTVTLSGLVIDVSASQSELLQMRRRATVDELTGVGNRFALLEELSERLDDSRYRAHDFALFMIDFNRLKELNDRFGHAFGDVALQQFATRVDSTLRPGDMVARLGGDEFAVIAAGVSTVDEVKKVAKRIVACTDSPFVLGRVEFSATVAIGAVLSDPTRTAKELLASADECMYTSKRAGRPFVIGSADRDGEIGGFSLKVELEDALADGQFVLLFQPKVDLATGAIVGFEGLSRWAHPALGMLEPSEFIHLLAEPDSARSHTDHVLDVGLGFVAHAAKQSLDVNIALNISALALFDTTLAMRIRKALTFHGVEASAVTLEVTESDIMEDITDPQKTLHDLARLGVKVAIDDFGTGYSSLARLRDLPVSEIKIDRRFVSNMIDNASDRVIVQSVCDLGRNLNLTVVAEGVEHDEQVDALVAIGCGVGQGFLFGQALDADAAVEALRESERSLAHPDLTVVRDSGESASEHGARRTSNE